MQTRDRAHPRTADEAQTGDVAVGGSTGTARSEPAAPPAVVEKAPDARRQRILAAATTCFAERGFHACTMQDVAAAAGMSPGNLYRYFDSKEALAVGLTERDRGDMIANLKSLSAITDPIDAFRISMRRYLIDESIECNALSLEIWAEATRNPVFASICGDFADTVVGGIADLVRTGQAAGTIARSVDPIAFSVFVYTLSDGLFVRRAVSRGFDAEREIDVAAAVIDAVARGLVVLPASPTTPRPSDIRSEEKNR